MRKHFFQLLEGLYIHDHCYDFLIDQCNDSHLYLMIMVPNSGKRKSETKTRDGMRSVERLAWSTAETVVPAQTRAANRSDSAIGTFEDSVI